MELVKGTKDYIRNPLGIVALFISLIYGFASLLLGTSAEKLQPYERYPLIIFIVVFPFVVLGVFYMLVTRHHGKLYGPADYKTDDSFLRTLSPQEKAEKLEAEIQEISDALTPDTIAHESIPEYEIKINPVARADKKKPSEYIREKIEKAENYVIRIFEDELGLKADVGIKIGPKGYVFDAVYLRPGNDILILEVKYYRNNSVSLRTVNEFLYRVSLASDFFSIRKKFVLALVFESDPAGYQAVTDKWIEAIANAGLDIEVRPFNGEDIWSSSDR